MPTLPSGITRSSGTLYDVLTIDLGIARSDVEVEITGDVISVIEITGTLDVKLNEKDEPVIELDKATRITITPKKFTKLFFTNPAQTGKSATLYIGREASFVPEAQRVGSVGILDSADVRIDPSKSEETKALIDDTIKGLLRSIGDTGDAPANATGETVLRRLSDIEAHVFELRRRYSVVLEKGTITATALGANASFTQNWVDYVFRLYAHLMYLCYSDVDGTMYSEFSHNATDVIREDSLGYIGGSKTGNLIDTRFLARYARVRYVNGATAQTTFVITYSRSD